MKKIPIIALANRKLPAAVNAAILLVYLFFTSVQNVHAISATWSANPSSYDWYSPNNWVPMTVPNGPNDIAIFDGTNSSGVSIYANTQVNEIVFDPGAISFSIAGSEQYALTISGPGISNNSASMQTFSFIPVVFRNSATAGSGTFFNSPVTFYSSSTAGNGTFLGGASFYNFSTAGDAVFNYYAAFYDSSTAGHATFNGSLDIRGHAAPGMTIGSIEGSGNVLLGSNRLTVGTNNLSTTFSGQIQDGLGMLIKTGAGTLVLTNSNRHTGGTRVDNGTLRAAHDGALGAAPQNGGYVSVGPNGTLTLDSGVTNDYIANRTSLVIVTGSTVNLNFSGAPDRVRSLIVDGVPQPPGVYGGPDSGAPNQLPQFTGTGTILVNMKAVSRKIHGDGGAFDIDLPATGAPGIECRNGGTNGDYQVVMTFANNVTFTIATLFGNGGWVNSSSGNGTAMVTVNLTGVTNAQTVGVWLLNLNDGTETTHLFILMGVLVGDVNANGTVNASDVAQVKAQLGQPVTASNFRADVNPNGAINASDVILVKQLSGTSLP